MPNSIKPRNTVKIKKYKVLDAYFATKTSKKEYETKTIKHTVGVTNKSSSLSAIAKAYKGVSWKDIQKENKMGSSTTIHPKQVLNITTKVEKGEKVTFKKLQSASLGDEVYVIVKTDNLQGKIVGINVAQGIEKGIVEKEKAIWLQQNDKDVLFAKSKVGEFEKDNKKITNAADFKDWAIIKIKLGSKDSKKQKEYTDALEKLSDKKTKLFLLIDAHSKNNITVIYNGRNPDKDGEPDQRTTPNYWLDMDGKWFELKKKTPIIVIDPGHGYTSGNVGSATRKYNHKIRGDDGKPKKDKKGNFILKKAVELNDLPQYVLDDVDKWITGHLGDTPGKFERELVFDVAHTLFDELKRKGYPSNNLFIFRPTIDYRNKNKGKTLGERIKYSK